MNKLVILQKQSGDKEYPYSYFQDEEVLQSVRDQNIVITEVEVPEGTIIGKEHAEKVVAELKKEKKLL